MHLFYTPDISSDIYTLCEEESKHCVRVLRLVKGDTLSLCDGKGGMYTARIVDDSVKRCQVEVVEKISDYEKRPYRLTMAVAPTKSNDRYEWFIEKATEIGVDVVTPLVSEHSERRVSKHDRMERVVTSAVKQSLKAYHPVIEPLTNFKDLISMSFDGDKFIAHCNKSNNRVLLRDTVVRGRDVIILIGPEGDFSMTEVDAAIKAGFKEISLGEARLRTETAAVVACHTVSLINQ